MFRSHDGRLQVDRDTCEHLGLAIAGLLEATIEGSDFAPVL